MMQNLSTLFEQIRKLVSIDDFNAKLAENTTYGEEALFEEAETKASVDEFEGKEETELTEEELKAYIEKEEIKELKENISSSLETLFQNGSISEDLMTAIKKVLSGDLTGSGLKELFDNENVSDFIDENKNGALEEDEIKKFLEYININDGEIDKLSLQDIAAGIEEIKNKNLIETLPVNTPLESVGAPENFDEADASGDEPRASIGGTVSLAGMSEEELNKKLEKKEETLANNQEKLSSFLSGNDSGLKTRQDSVDKWYEIYMRQLDHYEVTQEQKEQLQNYIAAIDSKEGEIDSKESEISSKEVEVSNAKTALENATNTVNTLESSLSALEGALGSAKDSEKSYIESQISAIQGELQSAREAQTQAEENLEQAESELEELQGEKETLSGELDELNIAKDQLEGQIVDNTPDVKYAMQYYNDAKDAYNEYKQGRLENLKAAVTSAQQDAAEIKNVINENKNRDLSLEYSPNELSREIVQFAKEFLGYNELDASADIFLHNWHSSSSQTGWCSAFVEYVLSNNELSEKVPDWFKNIENAYYQVNVYNAAKEADAVIEPEEAQPGDLVVYDYNGDGHMQHIGIVVAIEDSRLITIEGNSGQQVRINELDMSHPAAPIMKFCKVT